MLDSVLQELCPRCGAEVFDAADACPQCGFDPVASRARDTDPRSQGIRLRPMTLGVAAVAAVALLIVAFRAGMGFGTPSPAADTPSAADAAIAVVAPIGRVRFAERLGESLELEAYRSQFMRDDTIAWRAEFVEPPRTSELTLVITWFSIRERMQLTEDTVHIGDTELTMIASDEVPLRDLVPTAGMYEVAYYAGDVRLAIGVFELLPPAR